MIAGVAILRFDPARPANLFVLLAIPLGLAYAAVTPPMRVPDEGSHFTRVVQLAYGGLIGVAPVPASLLRFAQDADDKARLIRRGRDPGYSARELWALAAVPLADEQRLPFAGGRAIAYAPVPYVPAVVALVLARPLELGPLAMLYVARLAQLLGGTLLLYLALRIVPVLGWPLCLLALAPAATFLRSGVSADTLTTALALVLFALVTAPLVRGAVVRAPQVALLAVVAVALALAKSVYLPLTLVVLAWPRVLFSSRGVRRWALMACVALPWLVGLGWLVLVAGDPLGRALADTARADPTEQLALLRADPWLFVQAVASTWTDPVALRNLTEGWIGKLGLVDVALPSFLVPLFVLLALALTVSADDGALALGPARRALFVVAALGCVVAMSLVAYLQWSPPGSTAVFGIQGRYLTPLAPYLLLALLPPRGSRRRCPDHVAALAVAAVVVLGNVLGLVAELRHDWVGPWTAAP